MLNLTEINRMECFDISHTMGEQTVAVRAWCSTVTARCARVSALQYQQHHPGDDYAAMTQVLKRRYGKALEEKDPDVIFIDGGKGQLGMAIDVFKSLNVTRTRTSRC